ncbi:hypothetical protein J3F84DRAFT_381966 [Trichoderma pleuroticola]
MAWWLVPWLRSTPIVALEQWGEAGQLSSDQSMLTQFSTFVRVTPPSPALGDSSCSYGKKSIVKRRRTRQGSEERGGEVGWGSTEGF